MSDKAYVPAIPNCNICPADHPKPAVVDAKTMMGPWASMCDGHWKAYTAYPGAKFGDDPELGDGKGQRYILGTKPVPTAAERQETYAKAQAAMADGDYEAFQDVVGDGDPADFFG